MITENLTERKLFGDRESEWGYNNHIGELKMGFPDEKEETNRAAESERTVELTRLKKIKKEDCKMNLK